MEIAATITNMSASELNYDDDDDADFELYQPSKAVQTELQLTVLYGSLGGDPPCYLLEVSGCKILLDCGWNDSYDRTMLEPLKKVAKDIDLVLISHADFEHLGALPYARRYFGLTAPVYATSPVTKMGYVALYDAVLSCFTSGELDHFLQRSRKMHRSKARKLLEAKRLRSENKTIIKTITDEVEDLSDPYLPKCGFDLDDVDVEVAMWSELRYSQPLRLTGAGEGVVVTPYAAGRTVGGAVWRIHIDQDDVLYASDVSQRKEHHLDGMDLRKLTEARPSLLIADCASFVVKPGPPPRTREAQLADMIVQTLRAGGDVLMPVNSIGRVLEILVVLDRLWMQDRSLRASYPLIFLTRVSSVLDVAFSHLEWMSAAFSKQFDMTKVNPFELPCVHIIDSIEKLPSGSPRVILCPSITLEGGLSREVFLREIIGRSNSLVLFTERPFQRQSMDASNGSLPILADQLLDHARTVTFDLDRWVDLEGDELISWQEKQRTIATEAMNQQVRDQTLERMEIEAGIGKEPTTTNEMGAPAILARSISTSESSPLPPSGTLQRAASIASEIAADSIEATELISARPQEAQAAAESSLLLSSNVGDSLMFSFVDTLKGRRWDAYGEIINDLYYMDDEALERAKEEGLINEDESKVDDANKHGTSAIDDFGIDEADLYPSAGLVSDQDDESDLSVPRKRIVERRVMNVQCRVEFIDMGGWADGRSLVQIVRSLQPKKLVAVRGHANATASFVAECKRIGACGIALSPPPGECIDIASHSSVYTVRIPEETIAESAAPIRINADWRVQRIRGFFANGILHPAAVAGTTISHEAVHEKDVLWISQGEPSLLQLKEHLKKVAGIDSNFEDGVLVCSLGGNTSKFNVTVYKPPGGGRMQIGGPLCDLYFKIREIIYESTFTMA